MDSLKVGDTVDIPYTEGTLEQKYRFRITITEIHSSDEFDGLIDAILVTTGPGAPGTLTGGSVYNRFNGQHIRFHVNDITQH